MKQRVLVIYDDLKICRLIRDALGDQFLPEIYTSLNAEMALDCFLNHHYDAVVMDILLMDVDGLTLLSTMRRSKNTPILVLTEHANSEAKTQAMKMGADTYFDVPFEAEALIAQVQALIRRSTDLCANRTKVTLSFATGLIIDPQYRIVQLKGHELHFTRKEFDILYFLAKSPGQVLTMEQIYYNAWREDSYYGIDGLIKYHISRIRHKLDPHKIGYLESVRGIGYRFLPNINVRSTS